MHPHAHHRRRATSGALPAFTHSLSLRDAGSAKPRTDVGLSPQQPLRCCHTAQCGGSTDIAGRHRWQPRQTLLRQCPLGSPWRPANAHQGLGAHQLRFASRVVLWLRRGPGFPAGTAAPPTGAFIRPIASTDEIGVHWAPRENKTRSPHAVVNNFKDDDAAQTRLPSSFIRGPQLWPPPLH